MEVEKTIRIALIGCGGMAAQFRHIYTSIPGAELTMVVDTNEQLCRQVAADLQIARWSTTFEDALSADIDMLDISTPNFMHASQAIAALEAGKHVLLQKPMTTTVEEAEAIVETARRAGKTAGMYMSYFDNPIYYDIKKMVDAGLIGQIASVYCRGASTHGIKAPPGTWRSSLEKTGGGAFIQLAVHPMNMAQWLIGDTIRDVMAMSHNRRSPNIGGDDMTVTVCYFERGAMGTLEASYCSHDYILKLYGTAGNITVTNNNQVDLMLNDTFIGETFAYNQPQTKQSYTFPNFTMTKINMAHNPYDQHVAFVQAIQAGRPAPIPVEVGLRDMRLVDAVYRSAKEKRLVEVGIS
ncbi:Gfo/Idh/MocA family oxidoreductase [Paenibacillus oryzisoli]|uniref:Gfo/Idh/MocA family protein n=1 Tax=Paenibacillus oryzisoli TaxID=1850517 RepID=UPI003D2E36E9